MRLAKDINAMTLSKVREYDRLGRFVSGGSIRREVVYLGTHLAQTAVGKKVDAPKSSTRCEYQVEPAVLKSHF